MLYTILRALAALISKCFFRLEVCGKKHIPKKGSFILASNHASYLDPILLGVACSRKLNYMAKDELFSNRLSFWFFSKLGIFPVKRNSADIGALREAMRRLSKGGALVLFPQGRRMGTNNFDASPQAGVGFLAAKLKVPVIPAFIKGTEGALPKGALFIRPRKIFIYFGDEIPIERRMPYADIAKYIMGEIRHLSCTLPN